jgi:di/tricarboxylate transporter
MGPGGYRFTDYGRLGFPLSLIVVLLGVPLIALVWPLRPGG